MMELHDKESSVGNSFLLGVIALLLLLLYAPTAAWLWDRWTISVWQHAHGLLILIVVVYLLWRELRRMRSQPADVSIWGLMFLVPALVLHAIDAGMHTQLLSAAALILALPGLSLLFLGVQRTKAILFPLAFLLFTLPIPLAITENLHLILRKIATASSAAIIPQLGVPLYTQGTELHISNGTLQVADACSGFSTLYAAVAVACLVAYTCPEPRRRLAVLLVAVPLAIGANIIRVVLLVLLVHWKGIEILGTSWHTISGLFTFALVLPVIFWLGQVPEKKARQA